MPTELSRFFNEALGFEKLSVAWVVAILGFLGYQVNLGFTLFFALIFLISLWWWVKNILQNKEASLSSVGGTCVAILRYTGSQKALWLLLPVFFLVLTMVSWLYRKTDIDFFRKEYADDKLIIQHQASVHDYANLVYALRDNVEKESGLEINRWYGWLHDGATKDNPKAIFVALRSKPFASSYRSFNIKVRSKNTIRGTEGVAFLVKYEPSKSTPLPTYRQVPIFKINQEGFDQFLVQLTKPDAEEELLLFLRFEPFGKFPQSQLVSNFEFSLRVIP